VESWHDQIDVTKLGQVMSKIADELSMTREQLAMAWLFLHPAGIRPVLGTGKLHRIRELVEAQDFVLDRQVWFELLEAATGLPVP